MNALVTRQYSNGPALAVGLSALLESGYGPRELLFLALDPHGTAHLAIPDEPERLAALKVGEKLTLEFARPGAFYHFDSIHRSRPGAFLFNGDRRLSQPGNADDIAGAVTAFLRECDTTSVFFGCTPHPPGCWMASRAGCEALHDAGFVEAVPVGDGVIARRIMDHRLWQLRLGDRLEDAQPVFTSPLGTVLMLERRAVLDRLVLTCEGGLVEVDVSLFPWVMERARAVVEPGFAVVGRIGDAAFAVSHGSPAPWGFDEIRPAELVGAAGGSLASLAEALAR